MRKDIDACLAVHEWATGARPADLPGCPCLLIETVRSGRRPGGRASYYAGCEGPEGVAMAFALLEDEVGDPRRIQAHDVDRILSDLSRIEGVEDMRVDLGSQGTAVHLSIPRLGETTIILKPHMNLSRHLADEIRNRRREAKTRRVTVMTLFGIAMLARDADDAQMLLETVFNSGRIMGRHRGITAMHDPITSSSAMVTIDFPGLTITEDGMHLKDVPETVVTAISSRSRGGELSELIGHPAMRLLRIGSVSITGEGHLAIVPLAHQGRRMDLGLYPEDASHLLGRIMAEAHARTG